MKILKKDCSIEDGKDTSLPYTCYVVTYREEEQLKYDLVIGKKQTEIFDYYWDLYKDNFVHMQQSGGRANPKLWTEPKESKKK